MKFDDFIDILNLLKNPEQYEKKVLELKKHEDEIKKNIGFSADLGKIEALKQKAEKLMSEAEAKLAKAELDAAKTVSDAKSVFDKRNLDLSVREQAATAAIQDAAMARAEKAQAMAEVKQRNKELDEKVAKLVADQMHVDELTAELNERLKKLRSVMG